MMLIGGFNQEKKIHTFNYTELNNLLSHLDFSNSNYLTPSSFPFDISHDIYRSVFNDYLDKRHPAPNKIKN